MVRLKALPKNATIYVDKGSPRVFYNLTFCLIDRRDVKIEFVDNKYTNPTTTILYGNNCVFIQWSKEPIAIKIQNKDLAKSHLNYFNMLWDS